MRNDMPLKPASENHNGDDSAARKPWLCTVYVDEKFRGRGFAKTIVNYAVTFAKERIPDTKHVYLWTHNAPFYEHLGWRTIDKVDYAGEGLVNVLMQ